MDINYSDLEKSLQKYLKDHGFKDTTISFKNKKKGHIVVGNPDSPQQELTFSIRTPFKGNPLVVIDGDYAPDESLEYIINNTVNTENKADAQTDNYPILRKTSATSGLFLQASPNLQALYNKFPALKQLVWTHFYFGILRGLLETSVSAKLFMNLPEIGVLSMITGVASTAPGNWLGERRSSSFVNEEVTVITPSNKIQHLRDELCPFMESREWHVRLDLEEHLKDNYFKTESEFSTKYLAKYDEIAAVLKSNKTETEKAQQIGNIIFGQKSPFPEKDPVLFQHLKNLSIINVAYVEISLRKFYGQISAIPADIPSSRKLWTRGYYLDLVRAFCSVAEHGFYEEMDEELRILKEAEQSIKYLKDGKKLRKEDIIAIDRISREYLAFLLTNQRYFHEGEENLTKVSKILDAVEKRQNLEPTSKKYLETFISEYRFFLGTVKEHFNHESFSDATISEIERKLSLIETFLAECVDSRQRDPKESIALFDDYVKTLRKISLSMNKETLESKISSMRSLFKKIQTKDVNAKTQELDELLAYVDARRYTIKKAGISEKKVFCSLADVRKKFLEDPIINYTRSVNREEMKQILGLCFKEAKKANYGELFSHLALGVMLGISTYAPIIPGGRIANALGWGIPTGARSLFESYNVSKGGRVMITALLQIFGNAFKKEGIDAESAYSEFDSSISKAYLTGYGAAVAGALPMSYISSETLPWPIYIPVVASLVFLGVSYASWFRSVNSLREQIYNNAKLSS